MDNSSMTERTLPMGCLGLGWSDHNAPCPDRKHASQNSKDMRPSLSIHFTFTRRTVNNVPAGVFRVACSGSVSSGG